MQTIAHIDSQIEDIRTAIYALEMGHDFLSRADKEQIEDWNMKISELEAQRSKLLDKQ